MGWAVNGGWGVCGSEDRLQWRKWFAWKDDCGRRSGVGLKIAGGSRFSRTAVTLGGELQLIRWGGIAMVLDVPT